MQFEIVGNPDYGELKVVLDVGDVVLAEAGAMSRMSGGLEMQSRMMGGFLQAIARKLVGGESLFVGEYTAKEEPGYVAFAPGVPGCVQHRKLNGDSLILTAGAFMACTPDINLKPVFGGFKALFSGEGAFYLEASGKGELFFNGYGGVIEKEIDGEYIVDTGHVVAWEPSLDYQITGMGGWKQTLFSGEGLVLRFSGQGKIWVQTRTMGNMAGWLRKYC
ncbi:MAG: TIGR00266 family protein [Planctomycetaceae bacterium]